MRKSIMAGAMALACLTTPAFAATEAECTDMFKKADVNSDGVLSDAEANRYLAIMRVGNVTEPTDKRITSATFMEHCRKDVFKAAVNDANAPLKGANSFTEGQARDRAIARGFTDVTGLKKDDDGIWRGTASMEGKSVGVAIDYKGNVVSDASTTMTPSTAPMPTTPANPAPATNTPTTPTTPAPKR
jgi:hypothetical protein